LLGCHLLVGVGAAQDDVSQPAQPQRGKTSDDLSRLFPSRVKTFVKASYDPDDRLVAQNQGNDDGFSGMNYCESYRQNLAGAPMAVLAHFEGRAGVMNLFFRNFWSDYAGVAMYAPENNRTQIYLDRTLAYDMPLADYFRNEVGLHPQIPPFDGPFTGHRSGGHLTHAQLRWKEEFKLGLFDDGFFNAARFHRVAVTLGSPEEEAPAAEMVDWVRIARQRGQWPHAAPRNARRATWTIPSGSSQQLPLAGPATLLELACTAGAHADYAGLWARFTWDGQAAPAVDLPLRLLGGMMQPPARFPIQGLMFGNDAWQRIRTYMPMHFTTGAVLEFVNQNPYPVTLQVDYALQPGTHLSPWGYFTAVYRAGTTVTGQPFLGPRIDDAHGLLRCLMLEDAVDNTGRIPNVQLTHLEGDLCIRTNGNRGDDHSFDASETSIGRWGWYLTPADQPFEADTSFQSGIVLSSLPGGFFEGRRLMGSLFAFDPIAFVDGIEITLEHGVQNNSNADYGLTAFLYVEPGASRSTLAEIDVGDVASETANGVQFTQWSRYQRSGSFFRDQFFGTGAVADDVRHVRDFLRFRVSRSAAANTRPIGFGCRLDRFGGPGSSLCQAEVLVDGVRAGLLHSFTHGTVYPWKEGGECEVELPRTETDGKNSFLVEIRPRPGTDPLRVARIWVYEYLR
jgi:hypothetical protein